MTTSAQALNEVLSHIQKRAVPNEQFLTSVASFLQIPGPDAEAKAALVITRALARVKSDVEDLPLGEAEKKQLNSYLNSFNGITSFSHLHMDVNTARSNFLKADHLVGLMNVHMALSGHIQRPALSLEYKKIASDARELAEQVAQCTMPEGAKYALAMRLSQVATALDHYELFGVRALETDIETLLGSIAFHSDAENNDKDGGFLKRALTLAVGAANLLKAADGSFGSALALAQNTKKAMDMLMGDE